MFQDYLILMSDYVYLCLAMNSKSLNRKMYLCWVWTPADSCTADSQMNFLDTKSEFVTGTSEEGGGTLLMPTSSPVPLRLYKFFSKIWLGADRLRRGFLSAEEFNSKSSCGNNFSILERVLCSFDYKHK